MEVYPMEITDNKAQLAKDGKTVIQEVKYSDPYEEVKVRLHRRGNQVKVDSITEEKK